MRSKTGWIGWRQDRDAPRRFRSASSRTSNSKAQRQFDDLSTGLATERYERARRDQDLHNAQQGFNGAMAAFNSRLNQCAAQFCRMRARVAAIEARIGDDKQGA